METRQILEIASSYIYSLSGSTLDLITIAQPTSLDSAVNLTKIISKLSPIVGNLIEFNIVEVLNSQPVFQSLGLWKRQDPGFPDAIFTGSIWPTPGLEIKAWFPLSTEITARFKDSQNYFRDNHVNVAILAWLPEFLIFGKPKIIDICIVSGLSIAQARDQHYHNPPDYIILEPEETSARTSNLQQTNTSGYKWQGTAAEFTEAQSLLNSWGQEANNYQPTPEYQKRLRELTSRYTYRLDTNFAKLDRIDHIDIEAFKSSVFNQYIQGVSINQWAKILNSNNQSEIKYYLEYYLGFK